MTTPAETLRSAAKLMRERAEAATPGPWRAFEQDTCWYVSSTQWGQVSTGIHEEPSLPEFLMIERDRRDAEHIAGADPVFTRAVADWLASAARDAEEIGPDPSALAVALAYLGETEASDDY